MKKFLSFILILVSCSLLLVGCSKKEVSVTFNSNNGNPSFSVQVTVDSLIDKPSDPVRYGYIFDGWFYNGELFDFENNVITENTVLTAKWSGIKSTITFDAMGGEVEPKTLEVVYGSSAVKPIPTKINYVFDNWYIDDENPFNFNNIKIVEDITLYAKWEHEKPDNTYTVIFKNGDSTISTSLKKGDLVPKPIDPVKDGYDFGGWYVNGNTLFDFENTKITENTLTLVAYWIPKQFNITLDTNGGTIQNNSLVVEYGDSITAPIPTRVGYDFDGWYFGDDKFDFKNISILEDITLVAKWTAKTFTINFDANGGTTDVDSVTVSYNGSATYPTPTKTGYNFNGWYYGNEKFDFNNVKVLEDVTLVAKWTAKKVLLTFDANGGSVDVTSLIVSYGETITEPIPTYTGFKFEGWYDGDNKVSFENITLLNNCHLVAKWSVLKITITFDANGGTTSVDSLTITYGDSITPPTPTRTNYTFNGWLYEDEPFSFDNICLTEDITLYADWKAEGFNIIYVLGEHSVTLNPDTFPTVYYKNSTRVINLNSPVTADNKYVCYWYLDSDFKTQITKIDPRTSTGDIVLYAKWVPTNQTPEY